jgi:nucleoside-diphosphate-sugar epimerase
VYAVTRNARRAANLQAEGLHPIVADVTRPASLGRLPAAETVLYAVGFDRQAGGSMREVYVDGLRHALDSLSESTQRIVYISSTSVYAQGEGVWVDEASPCEPLRENGRIVLAAEAVLRGHRWGARSIVLRLAGIYGPGRIPRRGALAAGEPIAAPSEGYLNLIHVDDAVSIVLAAERCAVPPPRLYTVSDGHPVVRGDYYRELARLIGGPEPTFVAPEADSPAALRAEANKRVSNAKLLAELGVSLAYPSYREGLAGIVAVEAGAGL